MQTFLCAIFNKKTGHFSPPLLFNTKELAVSTFLTELAMPNSELAPLRDSLEIYCLGRYDVINGKIRPYLFKKLLWNDSSSVNIPIPRTLDGSNIPDQVPMTDSTSAIDDPHGLLLSK